MSKFLIIILSIIVVFCSCEKIENVSEIPEIKYLGIEVTEGDGDYYTAIGSLKFSFIDGNGDIGFIENTDTTTPTIHDIFVIEYYKNNSEFILEDTFKYWMPYFQEGVYRTSLKGELEIILGRNIESPDTVYYEFYITDRANHMSNIEVTPEIIYSQLLN